MKNARMDGFDGKSYTVYPGLRILEKESNDRYIWWEGYVKHELGLIYFVQTISHIVGGRKFLRISVISEGKEYQRNWNAFYGKKTIARLANEFIEEIKGATNE